MDDDALARLRRQEPTWNRAHVAQIRVILDSVAVLVGAQIQAARKAAGLSQTAVARQLEELTGSRWHQTAIAKTEAGIRPLRVDELYAFAIVLGTAPIQALLVDELNEYLMFEYIQRSRRISERSLDLFAGALDADSPGAGQAMKAQMEEFMAKHVAEDTSLGRKSLEVDYLLDVLRASDDSDRASARERLDKMRKRNEESGQS